MILWLSSFWIDLIVAGKTTGFVLFSIDFICNRKNPVGKLKYVHSDVNIKYLKVWSSVS